jgi:prepilin-type N-terminal cleavage/methylation domain-containing protein
MNEKAYTFHMRPRGRGFTLLELLIVIAIIGLLAGVVFASLDIARESARDSKRAQDVRNIQRALAFYATDHFGQFPTNPVSTQVANMNTGTSDITPYINPIPTDPTNTGSNGYRYAVNPDRLSYTILVHLEKNSPSWCSVSHQPGYPAWNNDPADGGSTNYPPCDFN